jgi:hypothetical protein
VGGGVAATAASCARGALASKIAATPIPAALAKREVSFTCEGFWRSGRASFANV